jgi:hypothetical protein
LYNQRGYNELLFVRSRISVMASNVEIEHGGEDSLLTSAVSYCSFQVLLLYDNVFFKHMLKLLCYCRWVDCNFTGRVSIVNSKQYLIDLAGG